MGLYICLEYEELTEFRTTEETVDCERFAFSLTLLRL